MKFIKNNYFNDYHIGIQIDISTYKLKVELKHFHEIYPHDEVLP